MSISGTATVDTLPAVSEVLGRVGVGEAGSGVVHETDVEADGGAVDRPLTVVERGAPTERGRRRATRRRAAIGAVRRPPGRSRPRPVGDAASTSRAMAALDGSRRSQASTTTRSCAAVPQRGDESAERALAGMVVGEQPHVVGRERRVATDAGTPRPRRRRVERVCDPQRHRSAVDLEQSPCRGPCAGSRRRPGPRPTKSASTARAENPTLPASRPCTASSGSCRSPK